MIMRLEKFKDNKKNVEYFFSYSVLVKGKNQNQFKRIHFECFLKNLDCYLFFQNQSKKDYHLIAWFSSNV